MRNCHTYLKLIKKKYCQLKFSSSRHVERKGTFRNIFLNQVNRCSFNIDFTTALSRCLNDKCREVTLHWLTIFILRWLWRKRTDHIDNTSESPQDRIIAHIINKCLILQDEQSFDILSQISKSVWPQPWTVEYKIRVLCEVRIRYLQNMF